jgi:hypothetical protein
MIHFGSIKLLVPRKLNYKGSSVDTLTKKGTIATKNGDKAIDIKTRNSNTPAIVSTHDDDDKDLKTPYNSIRKQLGHRKHVWFMKKYTEWQNNSSKMESIDDKSELKEFADKWFDDVEDVASKHKYEVHKDHYDVPNWQSVLNKYILVNIEEDEDDDTQMIAPKDRKNIAKNYYNY